MNLRAGTFLLTLDRPLVMGIVNVTPDSFSDGGRYLARDAAIAHGRRLIEHGADILDIGGESTRPGAAPASVQEELDRVMPVMETLCGDGIPISIDTQKSNVMAAAIKAGAAMINDVNALQADGALKVCGAANVAVCLMHKQGTPETMQRAPTYVDVVTEVANFLATRVQASLDAGIARDRIVIDPGFGFGKTLAHNLDLLRHLQEFSVLGVPLLAGLSRKSMLGAITGQDVEHRVHASVAAALLAVQRGARIVRVHDVGATVDALKVWNAVNTENTFNAKLA